MDEFIHQSQGVLGVLQSMMTPQQLEKSGLVAQEMYEAIREITGKHEMSVLEMMNAAVAVQVDILKLANEATKES